MRLECGCPSEWPDWDGKDVDLGGWLVHEQPVPMFIHMPIGFEACLDRQHEDIKRLELHEAWPGFVLAKTGMFRGKIYALLEDDHSPARKVKRLTNPFMLRARLFKGDMHQIRHAIQQLQSELFDEGKRPTELYLSYLTCPRCRDARGGTQIMILRHWIKSPKLERRLAQRRR